MEDEGWEFENLRCQKRFGQSVHSGGSFLDRAHSGDEFDVLSCVASQHGFGVERCFQLMSVSLCACLLPCRETRFWRSVIR